MPRIINSDSTVFEAAKERIREQYLLGNRLVASISGGKDSTVMMECLVIVARELGMLPIDAIMRDEEVMYPGTFEYLERVMSRTDEIKLRWVIAGQPIINSFNRFMPYWWVFDPDEQADWVRQPPSWAEWIPQQNIDGMTIPDRFPVEDGKLLLACIGLRAQESLTRLSRISSTGGARTKHPNGYGVYNFAPIYDWTDDDVWRAIREFGWDYNRAYDAMFRIGVPKSRLRIAPPSMTQGMATLPYAAKLWPNWLEAANKRIPGLRAVAYYGKRALRPYLLPGESWQQCMQRIIDEADEKGLTWLSHRCRHAVERQLSEHEHHSTNPLPQTEKMRCTQCQPKCPGSWEKLAKSLYNGDPWAHSNQRLPPLEPYELRAGAKEWATDGKKGALHW